MNKNNNKENLNDIIRISKKILRILYVLLIIVGTYFILRILKELKVLLVIKTILKILLPLFLGILIAWLLNPFVKWLEKKNVRRSIGTFSSYVILVSCLILLTNSIIPMLYNQTLDLVENVPNIVSDIKDWSANVLNNIDSDVINFEAIKQNLYDSIDGLSNNITTSLPSTILSSISTIISSIGTFVIGLVIGFFLLLSCNNLTSTLLDFIPKKFRAGTSELCLKINKSLRNYVNGALIDAFIVFVVSSIAFAIIGLKAPLLFGLFCGLMNVIPYAGPYIGGTPAVIVGFSQSTGIGIAVLIAIIIIQSIEGNVLQTLIISKTTKLNPVTIIIGLLIFGHFFGIIGMLLSTPIIGVCKVILKYFDEKYEIFNFN